MKLWEKGLETDKRIETFTVGDDRETDLHIAEYDVLASMAHARMLAKTGLISEEELKSLLEGLEFIQKQIQTGMFEIDMEFEDVHSKIEHELIRKLGDVGKKIHTARSRNDQVLVALHLYLKDKLEHLHNSSKELFDLLLELSETYKDHFMPGYTHFQRAMPSSFGLWFSAYAELLADDACLLKAAYKVVDQNPLGSAAGYGSSFPIDREETRKLLNFEQLKVNSLASQLSRGKTERAVASGLSGLAFTLNKFATDICIYLSQEFGFISFPDDLTTGSSIMPHKRNPDVFELIRAKCNNVMALQNQITLLTTNLPGGYHRDFQLLKKPIISAIDEMTEILEMFTFAIGQIKVKELDPNTAGYANLFSVDSMNALVEKGVPFRDAYKMIAESIQKGTYKPNLEYRHSHTGSIHNLELDMIRQKFPDNLSE